MGNTSASRGINSDAGPTRRARRSEPLPNRRSWRNSLALVTCAALVSASAVMLAGVIAAVPAGASEPVTVNVAGSQTYGGSPTFTYTTVPPGVTVSALTCSMVGDTTSINSLLDLGSYTVAGSSCSGSAGGDYTVGFGGVTGGFVVSADAVTVEVGGSQTYGGSPSFTYTTSPPGVTVSALTCSTAGGTPLTGLGAGTYALDGSSCSGSAGANYSLSFGGVTNGFVVNPEPVTVNVAGSQTYGGSPTFTYTTVPPGVTVSALTCSMVGDTTSINSSLDLGSYTVAGSSCSGSAGGDYSVGFGGVTGGFVVSADAVTVEVGGSQTYGGSPSFTYTTSPPGVTVSALTCSTAGGTPLTGLGAGTYALDGSSCSGSAGANYSLSFGGVADGFVVNPEPVTVNVAGSQTYGGSPTFTYTTVPPGVTVSALTCSMVGDTTSINSSLDLGSYTVAGSSCSGSAGGDYSLGFGGVRDGFVVTKATPVIAWVSPGTIPYGTPLGATQLDAVAMAGGNPVVGTYSYTPATGTVLTPGGNRTLRVTFTPSDTTDDNTATASVLINVGFSASCITGAVTGPLVIKSGQAICIGSGGRITNGVTIQAGGSLWSSGGSIAGDLTASGASAVALCSLSLEGSMMVTGSTGPVDIGGPACPAHGTNTVSGSVGITHNTGGVTYVGNSASGPITITNNSGGFAYSGNSASETVTVNANT